MKRLSILAGVSVVLLVLGTSTGGCGGKGSGGANDHDSGVTMGRGDGSSGVADSTVATDSTTNPADTGTSAADSAAAGDSGAASDSGPASDSGATIDSGAASDSGGATIDSGPASDSGTTSADTGAASDSGTTSADTGADSGGGAPDSGTTGPGDGGNCQAATASAVSVLMQHKNPSRDGLSIDPLLTNPTGLTRNTAFNGTLTGSDQVLAQPLYVANITPGADAVFIASESNNIYSLDSATGVPNTGWPVSVGTPVPLASLPCGSGINTYGITSTPVIDATAGVLYAESFYLKSGVPSHQVVAISILTGASLPGWPVPIDGTTVPGFTPIVEHARGALALVNGILYVPYSGLNGDCNSAQNVPYHGGVVGIDTASPTTIKSWFTSADWGGSWGTSGVASDGTSVYLTTGNTTGAGSTWGGGEAVVRFASGPVFSNQTTDYFAPHNWPGLDGSDTDLGSSAAILLDVPGAVPSHMLFAAGKEGVGYLLSQPNLGGIGTAAKDGLASATVANGEVKTAFAAYTTAMGSYVVLHADGNGASCTNGTSGQLVAMKIGATNPPTLTPAWCANPNGNGSPIVTMSGCGGSAVVWIVGATNSNRLYGFDGDTGMPIYTGGGTNEKMSNLEHWISPMEARGQIFVGGDGKVFAFK
jgi:hypothetical protein